MTIEQQNKSPREMGTLLKNILRGNQGRSAKNSRCLQARTPPTKRESSPISIELSEAAIMRLMNARKKSDDGRLHQITIHCRDTGTNCILFLLKEDKILEKAEILFDFCNFFT